MPDEDKPAPLRPATPARSRLRAVASPQPEPQLEPDTEGGEGQEPQPRLVDRIHQLAVRIEEESAVRDPSVADEEASEGPARTVRAATAKHAEQAAQRVAEAASHPGRHESPEPLPPLPLPDRAAGTEHERLAEPATAATPVEVHEEPVLPVKAVPKKAAKKAPAKKAPPKKALAKEPVALTAPAKKTAAKKTPAKKAAARKAPAKKVAAAVAASEAVTEAALAAPVPPPPPVAAPVGEAVGVESGVADDGLRRAVPTPPPVPRARPVVATMWETETETRPRPRPRRSRGRCRSHRRRAWCPLERCRSSRAVAVRVSSSASWW